jgi:chromosome segregation ATPase
MANAVRTKLQKISADYSAKVKAMRELEESKRKGFKSDSDIKKINEQIDKLDAERLKINSKLQNLTKLAKTAEEYLDVNKKLKEIEAAIKKAEARGEDTASNKKAKRDAESRLKTISPEVEKYFPEIKVAAPNISTAIAPTPGPTGTPIQTPGTLSSDITPTPTPTPTPYAYAYSKAKAKAKAKAWNTRRQS